MSISVCIDLEKESGGNLPGGGTWRTIPTIRDYAYPEDTETFENTLSELCEKTDSDMLTEYSCPQGLKWLAEQMDLLHEEDPDLYCDGGNLPVPPEDWELAAAKISVYW